MTSPKNTSAADATENLLVAILPGGIEAQEAAGQREMVAATTLPAEILGDTQAEFEALGFAFGPEAPGDPLFREATLPAGWTRHGSDHAMWSYIADERGIDRVAVFYKAAFYDRKAHMSLEDDRLTGPELADMRDAAEQYIEQAGRHPDVYGKRLLRARQIVNALAARDAEAGV